MCITDVYTHTHTQRASLGAAERKPVDNIAIPAIREAYPMQADGTDHPEKPCAAKVAAYCRELAPKVAAAAGEAARYYVRYVSPMLPHLQKRMFYSSRVRREPENRYTEDDLTSAFCGASDVWNSRIASQVL